MRHRLVKIVNDCKIYYNSESEEYIVKPLWVVQSSQWEDASYYYTNDLDDAEATSQFMLTEQE